MNGQSPGQCSRPNGTPIEFALFGPDAFSRSDESDDQLFYARDRLVNHLDAVALATVEQLIGQLIAVDQAVVLDLMAGWNSHLPTSLRTSKVIGLGLNPNELASNPALTEWIIHDLNQEPKLPFPDDYFDAVINTVSVDYITAPVEVFAEVGRILKPDGLFLVIFSNRMFPQKATKIWRQSNEEERILLVEDFFSQSQMFEDTNVFISKGKPRPTDDKYAHLGIPSDPIYAIYAWKASASGTHRPLPLISADIEQVPDTADIERRMAAVKETLQCPYCGERMRKWQIPQTPFTTWSHDFMYVCFNDACPYLVRGFNVMNHQGNLGKSYRLMYNPVNDHCMPVPVPSHHALKDGIIDEPGDT